MAVETRGRGFTATLTDHLADDVSQSVRQRGEQYLKSGAVARLAIDDFGIRAEVIGTHRYTVTLLYDGPGDEEDAPHGAGLVVRAACGCPYFDEGRICKHIWATVLAAELYADDARRSFANAWDWALLEADPQLPLRGPDTKVAIGNPVVIDLHHDNGNDAADSSLAAQANGDAPPPPLPRAKRRSRPKQDATSKHGRSRSLHRLPDWNSAMHTVHATQVRRRVFTAGEPWPADQQIVYVVDPQATLEAPGLVTEVMVRRPKQDGTWSKPQTRRMERRQLEHLPEADQQILALLDGASTRSSWGYELLPSHVYLDVPVQVSLVEQMCRTDRCLVRSSEDRQGLQPLHWRDEPTWELWLTVEDLGRDGCVIRGELRQPREHSHNGTRPPCLPLSEPRLLTAGGLMFLDGEATRFDHRGAFGWVTLLRQSPEVAVPAGQVETMLEQALTLPGMPPVELPERFQVERVTGEPTPHLRIHRPDESAWGRSSGLRAEVQFHYGDRAVPSDDDRRGVYDRQTGRVIERNGECEQQARARLRELGFRDPPRSGVARWSSLAAEAGTGDLVVAARNVPSAVAALVGEGWMVEAEGTLHRAAAGIDMEIRGSGIDWFELHGEARFGDQTVELPQLLQAMRRGQDYVRLDDGSLGMLPQEWIERYGGLSRLGEQSENGHVSLAATQIGLIDALLTQMPEVDFDQQVREARKRLERFSRVKPRKAPRGFRGELRPYQQDGLGWLHFLGQIGFGGCLADDMGLGKTIQVLALLESRRQKRRRDRGATPPSLVVVPRSLVHNWISEAKQFTPHLRVLDHTGPERLGIGDEAETDGDADANPLAHFAAYDMVLTTYGTLRQDIAMLKDVRFDYLVLDESQAIKNAATASAKSVRLLQGEHRLALSGTPIENHLGELVSLFEFLNPGMLGDPQMWTVRSGSAARADAANADRCQLLARAVRPFVLRRTKEQVATDLPEKIEQTLYCDLPATQRRHYDELRRYYGAQVMGKVESRGLKRSKIDVLHALLRLRQAACHPGLIDKARATEPAAKLDMLLPQIEEIVAEGHKALVFSQFTSFLSIVRKQVRQRGIDHAYIDGRTRKRQQQVERFQNEPACKLFLISLKAGGTGLNLTAADYVFLLDPWWNPAVEAQAIDRTHRIGQDKRVHAYRLIASDTVEEKVLELQQTKRDLADAIIGADANLIRELSVDDLRYLLS